MKFVRKDLAFNLTLFLGSVNSKIVLTVLGISIEELLGSVPLNTIPVNIIPDEVYSKRLYCKISKWHF